MNSPVDFCLHPILRLRLLNATAREIALVQRQLGSMQAPVHGDADITIRFLDQQPDHRTLHILGDWDAGYTRTGFWILRGSHGRPMAAQYPFPDLGKQFEITCCRPVANIPLLQTIINATALAKGFLPLHASAFCYGESPVLVTGWAKGGKTEALLGFAEHGATYVGDEWIYITGNGQRMFGIPQPIHLWDWHLEAPQFRSRLTGRQRWKLSLTRFSHACSRGALLARLLGAKTAARLAGWLYGRRHVQSMPHQLFPGRVRTETICPQSVFFMASHAAADTYVQPMLIQDVIARMVFSLEDEFSALLNFYRQFRFAFPEQRSELLDELPALLKQRLELVLGSKSGYAVWHPYPVSPSRLFEVMHPYVAAPPPVELVPTSGLGTVSKRVNQTVFTT